MQPDFRNGDPVRFAPIIGGKPDAGRYTYRHYHRNGEAWIQRSDGLPMLVDVRALSRDDRDSE